MAANEGEGHVGTATVASANLGAPTDLDKIEVHGVASRPIPAEFAIDGFYFRHEHHFVYWRRLSNGDIGIVTILHERMHQMDRFRDDLGG